MPYLGLIVMAMWVIALVDVIVAEDYRVRHLPKIVWLLIVIFLPLVGSVIWFVVGRPEGPSATATPTRTSGFPEYERPEYREAVARREAEEYQRQVRERAEQQRRRADGSNGRDSNDETNPKPDGA